VNQKRREKYARDKEIDNNKSRQARHWDNNKDLLNEKKKDKYAKEKSELKARKLESLTSNNNRLL